MIKRVFLIAAAFLLAAGMAGCSSPNGGAGNPQASRSSGSGADIDLTQLSITMAQAQIDSMKRSPDKYLEQTFKIAGRYASMFFEPTQKHYHFILIEDVSLCCVSDLEFIWNGSHKFPDDYPRDGAEIEIQGSFRTYSELGVTYGYIAADEVVCK